MPVRVVTDSSAVLPPAWIDRYAVEIVPLTITWDGEPLCNGDLSYERFAERIASAEDPPTTAAPSPGAFQEAYERLLDDAEGIVVLTPASEVTAVHQNASLAARLTDEDRIVVVDTGTAAAGQGLATAEAARAASDGSTLDEVAERGRFVAGRVGLWATLERLDYLERSGRVPGIAAKASGALDIHPIFRFSGGSPAPSGAARGAARAVDRVFRAFTDSAPTDAGRPHVLAFHSSRPDDAEDLRGRVLEAHPGAEADTVQITAAMAAHIGPGMVGLAWWWEPGRDEQWWEPGRDDRVD